MASTDQIARTEQKIARSLPTLLEDLYIWVANGGFGPGCGLIGVEGGWRSSLGDLVETYFTIIQGAEYAGLSWNRDLVPFCEHGCNIYFCVDVASATQVVHISEDRRTEQTAMTLSAFLTKWVHGEDVMKEVEVVSTTTRTIINPFTGKPHVVTAQRRTP